MAKSRRMRKVDELISQEVAKLIKNIFGDDLIVTVSGAQTSKDLRHSKVWISIYGNKKEQEEALKKVKGKKFKIQEALNNNLKMKYVPKVEFEIDKTGEQAQKIEEILKKEKDK